MFRRLDWLLAAAGALMPPLAVAEGVQSEFTAVNIEERSTGTFYIAGAIQGIGDLDMLVDTGSSYLVITSAMLDQLKTADRVKFSRNLEGHMADGSIRVIPLYRLAAIRLGQGCWLQDVEAAVFPTGSRPILGMNVLGRLSPFTFSTQPGQLGLSHCQNAPARAEEEAKTAPQDQPAIASARPFRR